MAREIFVCHASEDRAIADAVVAGLEQGGITCWVAPRDVMPGADYAQAIVAGISGAKALVLVFSNFSNASPHVSREVERAVSRGIDIIPFRIEHVEPSASLEYFISSAQWLDATYLTTEEHVVELAKIIRLRIYGEAGEDARQATRETLRDLVDRYGPELTDDPRRVRALLRDVAGDHRAEVAALFAGAEEGVGAALRQSSQGLTPELTERLVRRLQQNRALAEDASRWAVGAWVYALGMEQAAAPQPPPAAADELPDTVAATGETPPVEPEPQPPLQETVAATGETPPVQPQPPPQPPPQDTVAATGETPPPQPPLPDTVRAEERPQPSPTPIQQSRGKNGGTRNKVAAFVGGAAFVAVLVGGVAAWIANQGSKDAVSFASDNVYLEAAGAIEHVFTASLLAMGETHAMEGPTTTLHSEGASEVALVKGSDELIYAADRGSAGCNSSILLDELNGDTALSQVWADAQGIALQDIAAFVAGLTPMHLTRDVRVTTHVLDNGRVVSRQALLEQGTAVLVGATAEPRVRCASGSPLTLPVPVPSPTFVGIAWPAFDPAAIVELEPCEEPLTQFVLQDIATGLAFVRTIGSDTSADSDDITAATTSTTSSTTTTTAPTTTSTSTTTSTTTTTVVVADHDATDEGTVTASSRLCGSFAASKATDGDITTSWISSSGDGTYSTFQWTGTQDDYIGEVVMVSNAQNSTVSRRTNHGFAAVTIQVIDADGEIVFEEFVELPGTPDPDVLVLPKVAGRSVRLLLEGRENSSGSGFAEFTVMVAR
ncbi:MAG: toll/interleukin-1 receptor domain-containing protein [bacterium]|nr:toll/interleukin-1 receptor domain-containing protein [bacterium]